MVRVVVSPAWKKQTGGATVFDDVPGGTVADILYAFAERFPDNRQRLIDRAGRIYRYFNVYVDSELVPFAAFDSTQVRDGVIEIVPPLAGG